MMDPSVLAAVVIEHLPAHLALQRWSGAHDRPIASVELDWQEVVRSDDPMLLWAVARVRFVDGGEQRYQLFLGVRPAHPLPEFLHSKEASVLAVVEEPQPGAVVFDALVDPDLAVEVLHLVAPGLDVGVRRPMVLEHSNSSVVFDEAHILKVFRRVEDGANPDAQITRVLALAGCEHVLPPRAELQRDGVDLAVLRDFLVGCTEGWELARASVRDLLAGGEPAEDAGADFAPDAERLGALLADLHLSMAAAFGRAVGDAARWLAEMEAGLEHVLTLAASDPSIVLDVGAISDCFRVLAKTDDVGSEIRIHGDLHLAQLIKSDDGWKVLDFDGEPARRRIERFTTSSPLRDLAGLLRSFDYAAATGLLEWGAGGAGVVARADQWAQRNRDALRTGYLGTTGIEALLPATPDGFEAVLRAFELDKAVYELGYEIGHRPDHVRIPLAGIGRLLGTRAGA